MWVWISLEEKLNFLLRLYILFFFFFLGDWSRFRRIGFHQIRRGFHLVVDFNLPLRKEKRKNRFQVYKSFNTNSRLKFKILHSPCSNKLTILPSLISIERIHSSYRNSYPLIRSYVTFARRFFSLRISRFDPSAFYARENFLSPTAKKSWQIRSVSIVNIT